MKVTHGLDSAIAKLPQIANVADAEMLLGELGPEVAKERDGYEMDWEVAAQPIR